jgi:hypothetical protein
VGTEPAAVVRRPDQVWPTALCPKYVHNHLLPAGEHTLVPLFISLSSEGSTMHLHRFRVSGLTAVMAPARMFAEASVAVRRD